MAKTGSKALEEAKKKINDPNYNVFSGNIEKDKNKQTGENKRRVTTSDVINTGSMLVGGPLLGTGAKIGGKIISKLGPKIKKFLGGSSKTKPKVSANTTKLSKTSKTTKTKPSNTTKNTKTNTTKTPRKNAKIYNTPIKRGQKTNKPLASKNKIRDNVVKGTLVTSTGAALSNLIPKGGSANKNKKISKSPEVKLKPNKSPIKKVKKEKLKKMGPTKDYTGKFVNKKGEVAYDSVGDFFKNITGTAKKRVRPENRKRIQSETKGATKGIGFTGKSVGNPFKLNRGGKMVKRAAGGLKPVPEGNKGLGKLPSPVRNKMGYMRKGGVVKMRGGGAATKGMNFNRGY